jgi:hypothetical protein
MRHVGEHISKDFKKYQQQKLQEAKKFEMTVFSGKKKKKKDELFPIEIKHIIPYTSINKI